MSAALQCGIKIRRLKAVGPAILYAGSMRALILCWAALEQMLRVSCLRIYLNFYCAVLRGEEEC